MGAASGRGGVWEVDQAPGLLTHMDQRTCPAIHTLCDWVRLRGSGVGVGVGRSSPTPPLIQSLYFSVFSEGTCYWSHVSNRAAVRA